METAQLRRAATRHRKVGPDFGGVFACDRLPRYADKKSYIINLDPAHKEGSHWVAVFFDRTTGSVDYFDSYGLKPKNVHIIRFLKRNSVFKHYNLHTYQSPCSVICGQYSLYFLFHRSHGHPMKVVQRRLHSTMKASNDRRVVRFGNLTTRLPYIDPICSQISKSLL